MTKSTFMAFVIIFVCSQAPGVWAEQSNSDAPIWSSKEEDGKANLVFMNPGSDEIEIAFDCKPKSGKIHFFVGQTSPLKPNAAHTGSFAVGATNSTFAGRTVPNEMSATSSFEADISSEAQIFSVMTGNKNLEIRIGRSFQKLSLKTTGDKATTFAARCRK